MASAGSAPIARRQRRNRLDRSAESFFAELRVRMQRIGARSDVRRRRDDEADQLVAGGGEIERLIRLHAPALGRVETRRKLSPAACRDSARERTE